MPASALEFLGGPPRYAGRRVTRLSTYFLPTLREDPADAESISHRLMVRAGLVRQLGAGLWTWLPAGYRVIKRVEAIIRSEIDAIGGQEMLMPVLQPAEPWRRTGRYEIDELFKLTDRKGSEHVLAMTHEEALTFHVAREIRSYRELPKILYHLQVKERDEPRPRAGVLRTREFTMKDSYSFDRDAEGLDRSYELHRRAYARILDRCELRWYEVESDVGMMGGSGAHEYMAPCEAGENEVALAPGYAANVEVASAQAQPVELPPALDQPREVPTPGLTTVDEVSAALGVAPAAALKAIPVIVEGRGMVVALVRGDHRLNEIKLRNALGTDFRQATAEEIEAELGPPGFIGPVGAEVEVVKDAAIQGSGFFAGANRPDAHLIGVEPGRDFNFTELDFRSVEAGDLSPARRSDRDRDRDRGRQHLQARDPLLGAARRHLPRPRRGRAADRRWAATGSVRRGSSPPRSSRAPTSKGIVWPRAHGALAGSPGRPRQGGRGHGRGCGEALRAAHRTPAWSRSTTTARPGRARSSPTPSCSAARCGSSSASGPSPRARSRRSERRSGADHRLAVADAARRAGEILDALG